MKIHTVTLALLWAATAGCPAPSPKPERGDAAGEAQAHPAAGEEHADLITLSPEAQAAAQLTVTPARAGRLRTVIDLPARITLDPTRHALVGAWIGGQVDEIRVKTGDHLKAGQRLASIHTPELGAAVGAYRGARALHRAAQARLERLQMLEAGGVSSRAQVLDAEASVAETQGALEAAEERLRVLGVDPSQGDPAQGEHYPAHVPVVSPIRGEVLEVFMSVGQQVGPGAPLFRVGDLDEVWLIADLYDTDLSKVREGQEVSFTVDAWPGERFVGQVEQVGSWVEPAARTVELRAAVRNRDHRLKPNLFARASITSPEGEGPEGVLVPASAVVEVEGNSHVFTQTGPGEFTAREVVVAARSRDEARLSDGIAAGEVVVTAGAFTLKSELEKAELGGGHGH